MGRDSDGDIRLGLASHVDGCLDTVIYIHDVMGWETLFKGIPRQIPSFLTTIDYLASRKEWVLCLTTGMRSVSLRPTEEVGLSLFAPCPRNRARGVGSTIVSTRGMVFKLDRSYSIEVYRRALLSRR